MPYQKFDYLHKVNGKTVAEYECRIDAELVDGGWYGNVWQSDVRVNGIELSVLNEPDGWTQLPADHFLYPLIEAAFISFGDISEAA